MIEFYLTEPHINSSVYRQASKKQIAIDTSTMDGDTANLINTVVNGLNDYLFAVAEKQIYLAFEHAQSERELLSKRTSEGLKQAKLMGSKVGRQKGQKVETKKQKKAKRYIKTNYKAFGGILNANECMKVVGVTKSTFYRYLDQIVAEDKANGIIWDNVKREVNHKVDADVTDIQAKVAEFHKNKNK